MFLRKTKVKGNIYWQIVEAVEGKQKMLLHLGTVENIYKKLVTKQQNKPEGEAQQQKEAFVYKESDNSIKE